MVGHAPDLDRPALVDGHEERPRRSAAQHKPLVECGPTARRDVGDAPQALDASDQRLMRKIQDRVA